MAGVAYWIFFATAVERVIQKFKESSVKLAAFELYIPHRSPYIF